MSAVVQSSAPQAHVSSMPTRERRKEPLRACVQSALELYFRDLDGHEAEGVYDMVVGQVEQAMLESVMRHVRSNQTRAADVLGINRSTLRKKLKLHGLL